MVSHQYGFYMELHMVTLRKLSGAQITRKGFFTSMGSSMSLQNLIFPNKKSQNAEFYNIKVIKIHLKYATTFNLVGILLCTFKLPAIENDLVH